MKIISVGKVKEPYFNAAFSEYEKRISSFIKLKTIVLPSVYIPDNPSKLQIKAALDKEAFLISEKLSSSSAVIVLSPDGKSLKSSIFAEIIQNHQNEGKETSFIIGSSYGISENLKNKYQQFSLSDMTFQHGTAKLMLEEQIYRALMILNNRKYVK